MAVVRRKLPPTSDAGRAPGARRIDEQLSPDLAVRLDWWLREGWPTYIGENRDTAAKKQAICATRIPAFKKLADGPGREATATDATRYYTLASTVIEYLLARSGPDAYRQLLILYEDVVDANTNLPHALGMTPDQFYSGWIAYAKRKYC